jgi:hypothetical protein
MAADVMMTAMRIIITIVQNRFVPVAATRPSRNYYPADMNESLI